MVLSLRLGAGVLAATFGVAACSASPDQVARDEPGVDAREAIRDFYQSWAGTAADQQAAAFLQAYGSNGSYAACVEQRGLNYAWEASIALVPAEIDDGTWHNVWTFPTNTPLFSTQQLSDAHNAAMELRMNNADLTQEENEVGLACREENPGDGEDQIDEIGRPRGLDELDEAWAAEVDKVTSDLPSDDEWSSCILQEGIPSSRDGDAKSLDEFQKYLSELAPDFRVTATPAKRLQSPDWKAYLDAEQVFLRADAECRSATVEEVLPKVADASVSFAVEYKSEISELAAHWAEVRRDASALGWSANRPLGDMSDELLNQPLQGIDESN